MFRPITIYFERDTAGVPVHYFDWTNLENLDYRNPAVADLEIAAFQHGLCDFDTTVSASTRPGALLGATVVS